MRSSCRIPNHSTRATTRAKHFAMAWRKQLMGQRQLLAKPTYRSWWGCHGCHQWWCLVMLWLLWCPPIVLNTSKYHWNFADFKCARLQPASCIGTQGNMAIPARKARMAHPNGLWSTHGPPWSTVVPHFKEVASNSTGWGGPSSNEYCLGAGSKLLDQRTGQGEPWWGKTKQKWLLVHQ